MKQGTSFRLLKTVLKTKTFGQKRKDKTSFSLPSLDVQKQKELDKHIDSEELADLYEVLSEPVNIPDPLGPSVAPASKLDPEYLKSLRLQLEDATRVRNELLDTRLESVSNALKDPNQEPRMDLFTQLIQVNALTHRPAEAHAAFQLIEAKGLKPDEVAYNNLMDAYARVSDLEKTLEVFKQMRRAGIQPDVVTYGVLIKVLVKRKDMNSAFKLYTQMKQRGILLTQPIYSMLIHGCLRTGQIERAWKTFDHMRLKEHQPDTVTYTLMIQACSKTQDAERALDLFQEMTEKGHPVNEFTYAALIRACASRRDYYTQAWELLEQMVAQGFSLTSRTYGVLLESAAKQGDIVRARMVWNDRLSRMEAEEEERAGKIVVPGTDLRPNNHMYEHMLEAYAKALSVQTKRASWSETCTDGDEGVDASEGEGAATIVKDGEREQNREANSIDELDDDEDASEMLGDQDATGQRMESAVSVTEGDLCVVVGDRIELRGTDNTEVGLFKEAAEFWSVLTNRPLGGSDDDQQSKAVSPRIPITTHMLDTYLRILATVPRNPAMAQKALDLCNNTYTAYGKEPGGTAYRIALSVITKNKELMKSQGKEFWERLLAWDAEQESKLTVDGTPMTELEKEEMRTKQHRGKAVMHRNFKRMIAGYARLDDLDTALDILESSHSFRYQYYLPPIHFKDCRALLEKCRDQAEDGHLQYAKRLASLCPVPSKTALEHVQKMLKDKWLGDGKWWGWKIVFPDKPTEPGTSKRAKRRKRILEDRARRGAEKKPKDVSSEAVAAEKTRRSQSPFLQRNQG
ncbi:hypothetical protein HDV00_007832 [Rhizophlyctis rosea]|nr:hypothetical protein HDV00_007832 [Rhizophlyctis rosea]